MNLRTGFYDGMSPETERAIDAYDEIIADEKAAFDRYGHIGSIARRVRNRLAGGSLACAAVFAADKLVVHALHGVGDDISLSGAVIGGIGAAVSHAVKHEVDRAAGETVDIVVNRSDELGLVPPAWAIGTGQDDYLVSEQTTPLAQQRFEIEG